ncbi:MAG: pitrilysin family protein, partial [bacterium]
YTPRYGGTFNISFTFDGSTKDPEKRISDVMLDLSKEIKKLKNDVSINEIEKAKTILLSDKVYEREKVEGFASKIGHLVCVTGGLDFEKTYFARLRKIGVQNITDVMGRYLDASKVSISAVVPNECEIQEKKLLEIFNQSFITKDQKKEKVISKKEYNTSRTSVVDSITEDADYNFDAKITVEEPEMVVHKSGAKIITRRITSTPLVSMKVLMPGGVLFETEANQGISNLLARTLTLGADDLSFADIADIIDSTASSLSAFSGRNSVGISVDFMKPFFSDMLDLTSKIILKPKFKQDYFDTEKKVIEDDIRSIQDNLAQYARQLLLKTMYKEYPYKFDILGTLDSIKKITRTDVIAFYKMILNPKKLVFSVTGDFNKSELLKWVDDLISKIDNKSPEIIMPKEEPEQAENRITRFKKESKQAHIFIAYKTCGLRSTDKYPLSLIDSVLGGQSGRLFMELRDKQSLAYTVAPIELYGPETGYFGAYIASENAKVDKAIEEIRKQIKRLVEDSISEKELLRGKNFIIGRNAISMQSFSEQAITMGFDEMFGDGYSTMLNYSKSVLSLTTKDIQDVARKYFKDGRENVSIVSN